MPFAGVAAVTAALLISFGSVNACGLEAVPNAGFTVSYPGSFKVAVAVADARQNGLLAPATTEKVPNEVQLNRMLSDLRRLQKQLGRAKPDIPSGAKDAFSLVLVGPGLWSHFYLTRSGILAKYHTDGPMKEKAVILTHHAVLQALLKGNISLDEATNLGLVAYSGRHSDLVRSVVESGFGSKKGERAAVL